MSRVMTGASVSLDGYISGPGESGFDKLFAWYDAGDIKFESTHPEIPFNLTEADYAYLKGYVDGVGVLVVGRKLFDQIDGWGGIHPLDRPVVVVTHSVPEDWVRAHPEAPFTFVTDGVAAAIERARQIAGDRNVGVNAGKIASQCLELGLLDEVYLDLVPVVLGGGTPYFETLSGEPVELDGPDIIPGARVTHLRYVVRGH
ncbi:MAG TPA: deaminase [Candidatus Limnocylindria bacterium]|nr:deaminase [Candidatus Limnocylindria bacterium]